MDKYPHLCIIIYKVKTLDKKIPKGSFALANVYVQGMEAEIVSMFFSRFDGLKYTAMSKHRLRNLHLGATRKLLDKLKEQCSVAS